jgi:subtilisin family serine protease
MRIKRKISRMVAAVAALSILVSSQMVYAVDDGAGTEQEVIVVYKNEEGKDLVHEESVEVEHEFEAIPAVTATVTSSDLSELVNDPNIAYVERNISFQMADQNFSKATSAVPAEQSQWNFQAVQPVTMWDAGFTGSNIKVAVVDSGVYAHRELSIAGGISTVNYTSNYTDDNGHGTHVAGIIAARNDGEGLVGVAPDVQLYAVKALNQNGQGTLADILEGLDWAINNNMDIINLSLGTEDRSLAMEQMVARAYSQGILVVAATGNSQEGIPLNVNTVNYPAKYDTVIGVGATDAANNRGIFSSAGEEVEVSAPGVDVVSTYVWNETSVYALASGTSQATPHVSGMLALLKQKYPAKTNVQLREELRKYAVDLGTPGRDIEYGFGTLSFKQADTTAPGNVTNLQVTGKTDHSVSFTWTNPLDPDFITNHIYVNNVKAGMTAEQTYMVDSLLPNTFYTFAVKSVDGSGNESAGLTVTQATYAAAPAIDKTAPAEVTALKAYETTTNTIRLSWNNPADADFEHANVYVGGVLAGETANPRFELSGLLPDTAYDIVVRTVDASSNISVGAALAARTQAIPILVMPVPLNPVVPTPVLPNPVLPNPVPVSPVPGGDFVVVPTNPTPAPSGGIAIIPPLPAVEDKESRAAESALENAGRSHTISDFVKAQLAILNLADQEDRKKFQEGLEELKKVMGVKDLPAKNEVRRAVPIGINLQVAMKSSTYKYIDTSSLKPGENVFVLNSKGETVQDVRIRVVFNRILVTPATGSFPSNETFTILIDKSIKGKPSQNSGAAYELKNPLLLEFTTK